MCPNNDSSSRRSLSLVESSLATMREISKTTVKPTKYTTSRTVILCISIHSTLAVSEWKIVETMVNKRLVRYLFFSSLLFSSWIYYSDHYPRIIDNEKVLHSQSHPVSNGMWALAPSAVKHIE